MTKKRIAAGVFCALMVIGGIGVIVEKPGEKLGPNLGMVALFVALTAYCFYPALKRRRASGPKGVRTPLFKSAEAKILCDTLFSQGPQAALRALHTHGEAEKLDADALKKRVVAALPFAVDAALEDGLLTQEEEDALGEFFTLAGVTGAELGRNHELLVKAALTRDLLSGTVKPRAVALDTLPFVLNKNEVLIWAFPRVEAGEYKTKMEYVGGNQGVSVRVAKGVYWRTGAYRGERLERQFLQVLGTGPLVVTSKHVYFKAGTDALRVAHKNVISITPMDSAVMVHRSGERNKPLVFATSDPCFLMNLLTNASNWA